MELDKFLESEGPRAINPDMPQELIKDISKCVSLRKWKEEAVRGFRVRQNLALLRQRLIGQATRRLEWYRKAGMRMVARVDEDLFWQHRLKYGPGCWHNDEFREDTLKRHPEMAVPETRRSVGVLVNGLKVSENQLNLPCQLPKS